jgi:hypothetical protein
MMMFKLWLILLFLLFTVSYGKPVKSKSHAKAPKVTSNTDALKYLEKFGYNHCGGHGSGNKEQTAPLCQSSFQTMIKHFQTIFHLPVTGKLDSVTTALMNRARCSLGDYPMGYSAFRPWSSLKLIKIKDFFFCL